MDKQKLINNFTEMLEESPSTPMTENTIIRDLDEWDSMTALSLMAMIDEEYGLDLNPKQLESIITINDLFSFLDKT